MRRSAGRGRQRGERAQGSGPVRAGGGWERAAGGLTYRVEGKHFGQQHIDTVCDGRTIKHVRAHCCRQRAHNHPLHRHRLRGAVGDSGAQCGQHVRHGREKKRVRAQQLGQGSFSLQPMIERLLGRQTIIGDGCAAYAYAFKGRARARAIERCTWSSSTAGSLPAVCIVRSRANTAGTVCSQMHLRPTPPAHRPTPTPRGRVR